jgi:hypothetical protein
MRPNDAKMQISTKVCLSDCSLICVEAPYSTLGADQRAAVAAILSWVTRAEQLSNIYLDEADHPAD